MALCFLSKGSRISLRKPRTTTKCNWRLQGYNYFHNGYCVLNLFDGSVRYLKPDTRVYIFF